MQITRDNYENFFLLYVDGELCANDRKAVENFAAADPGFQQELNMLKETVLRPDETMFTEKSALYKTDVDDALQEKLLLKIDNELPEAALAALNVLLLNDPAVGNEYRLLQLTRLNPAEQVIFPDKAGLYRRERGRVVPGGLFWRAAAAVLIGTGLFFGISYLRSEKSGVAEIVVKTDRAPAKDVNTTPVKQNNIYNDTIQNTVAVKRLTDPAKTDLQVIVPPPDNIVVNDVKKINKLKRVITRDEPVNDRTPQQDLLVLQKKMERDIPVPTRMNNEPSNAVATIVQPKKTVANVDNNITPLENGFAQAVPLPDNDRSGNRILYMDEDDVKRSKAGGLFRKVKRFMERTAKIKTGDFRIAGFQTASK